jgi:galactokinase
MKPDSERLRQVADAFEQRFGAEPTIWARAPGRVDLMGSHTDYNLGYVLTLPIGRDTWIAARPRADRVVALDSLNLDAGTRFSLDAIEREPPPSWSNYVRGVASVLQAEGLATCGFDGVIHSTVPISSGLSSSAALECVTAVLFQALGGWQLEPVAMARLCQRAENQFVGVNCGILDQYTSCAGQEGCALLLDCRDLSNTPVKLADGIQIVICDTKAKRELAGSEYGKCRAQCEEGARRSRSHRRATGRRRLWRLHGGVCRARQGGCFRGFRAPDLCRPDPDAARGASRRGGGGRGAACVADAGRPAR